MNLQALSVRAREHAGLVIAFHRATDSDMARFQGLRKEKQVLIEKKGI